MKYVEYKLKFSKLMALESEKNYIFKLTSINSYNKYTFIFFLLLYEISYILISVFSYYLFDIYMLKFYLYVLYIQI